MSRIDINRTFAQNWTTVARFSTLLWGGTKGVSTVAIRENAKCEKSAVLFLAHIVPLMGASSLWIGSRLWLHSSHEYGSTTCVDGRVTFGRELYV
jgi:hypothetical protein